MNDNNLLNKIIENNNYGNISEINFIFNLLLSLILSLLVSYVYKKYGRSISNRKEFASIFPLLAMTTMLVISIVKSSLALSLGLVGALSIVRFRSAIKEPEELVYIFLSMAIGLSLGANQVFLTIIAVLIISLFIIFRSKKHFSENNTHVSLMISYPKKDSTDFDEILDVIKKHCESVSLRRYSENQNGLETVLILDLNSFNKVRTLQKSLSSMFPEIEIDFVDGSFIWLDTNNDQN